MIGRRMVVTDELSRRLVRSEREADADEGGLVRVSRDGRIGPSPVASKAELAEHAARVKRTAEPEAPRRFQVARRNDNELILFVGDRKEIDSQLATLGMEIEYLEAEDL